MFDKRTCERGEGVLRVAVQYAMRANGDFHFFGLGGSLSMPELNI